MPFGEKSFLQIDLYHQYAPFYEEMRSRILSGQSLEFSWEGSLGKEFLVQWAYMNSSLIGFLILLFPAEKLPEAIHLMMALKISLACASFCWYLKKSHHMEGISAVMFALFYGWCGFVTCYFWNIMWLDAVVLFPLLILGIDYIIEEKKSGLYLAALTLTIYSNFYIAFLVCVVISLYCFLRLISYGLEQKSGKEVIWRGTLFAGNSILAALFTMFLILPTVIALSQTAVSGSAFPSLQLYSNIWQLLSAHLIGVRPVVLGRNEDLPNLFSGVFSLLLAVLFFTGKRIPREKKIRSGILILFFWLCSVIQPLDFLIHGLHFPANLPHRFTFMYSFFLIGMASDTWQEREAVSWRKLRLVLVVLVAITGITEFGIVPRIYILDRIYSNQDLLIGGALLLCYAALWKRMTVLSDPEQQKKIALACLLLAAGECLYSGYDGMNRTTDAGELTRYMEPAAEAKAYLDEREQGDFYRMEFRRFVAINNGALYHYPGVSQFSSLAPGGISTMMTNLGFAGAGNSYRYYDPTPLLDAMLDVKYVLNRDDEGAPTSLREHYDFAEQIGNLWIFENPQILPVGFLVSEALKDWAPESNRPFDNQNSWAALASGIRQPLLHEFLWERMVSGNITVNSADENGIHYTIDDPKNLDQIPNLTVTFVSPQKQYLYLYVNEDNAKRVAYTTGKERQDREIAAGNGLIDVGWVEAGEKIEVSFDLTNRGEFEKSYRESGSTVVQAAGFDFDAWNQVYEKLNAQPWRLTGWSDTWLEGSVQAESGQVLFTSIPYMRGWTAYVDGEKTELLPLAGSGVIGVPVGAGTHEIRLEFRTPGLRTGRTVSLIALLVYALCFLIGKFLLVKKLHE